MFIVVFDYMTTTDRPDENKVAYSYTQIFAKKSELNRFISHHKKRSELESYVYGLYAWAKVDEVDFDDKICTWYVPWQPNLHIPFRRLTRENVYDAANYVDIATRRETEEAAALRKKINKQIGIKMVERA